MLGRPNPLGGPAPGRPDEDLDGVLNRFQNWTKMHQETVNGATLGRPQENAKFEGGAREVSYEQALRSSGYRRPVDIPLPSVPPAAVPAPAAAGTTAGPEKQKPATPGKKMAAAAKAKGRPARKSNISYPPTHATASPLPSKPPAVADRAAGRNSPASAKRAKPAQEKSRNVTAEIVAAPARTKKQERPAFEEVLRESAMLAHNAPAALATLETAHTVTLTLRMAEAEHAKIQARAAFATLSVSEYLLQCALGQSVPGDPGMAAAHERQSVSAYLRHCAAGIDELRDRVEAIALNCQPDQPRVAVSAAAPLPMGFWRRIGNKFKRRGQDDYSSITLR